MESGPGTRRAWGWVAALRAGSVTPWAEWTGEAEPLRAWLPGAQQLELLRRVNVERARRGLPGDPALADRILAASAPGRGRPDLPVSGAGPEPRFGPRPVDPGALPARELVRVAAGLLAEDLVAAGPPAPVRPGIRGVRRPWAPSYRLAGDPWLVRPALAGLVRRGRPPRERPRHVYVLGADLETMVVHAWTARAFDEGGAGWREWLAGMVRADRLPSRADLLAPARAWAERIGSERVCIVLDPTLLPPRLVGRGLVSPPAVGAAGADLARQVGASLALLVGQDRRAALLMGRLAPRLDGIGGPALAVPESATEWLADRADRMRRAVARGGYPVVGDPDRLLVARAPGSTGGDPSDDVVLGLAAELLIAPVQAEEVKM